MTAKRPCPLLHRFAHIAALLLLSAGAACASPRSAGTPGTLPAILPTSTAVTAPTLPPAVTDIQAPSPPPATLPPTSGPTAAEPATSTPAAGTPLLDFAWDDRAPFRAGLRPAEQGILAELPGATVYNLQIDITNPRQVRGEMAARYTNLEDVPLDELVLHLFPAALGGEMSVRNVRLDGQPVAAQADEPLLRVPLAQSLPPGESVVLALGFDTAVPGADESTKYQVLAEVDGTLALAHFYPMFAAYDERGWHTAASAPHGDETFADSSFYLVEITAPAAQTVVTSGVTLSAQQIGDLQQLTVAAGPMRDFYLAANEAYALVSAEVDGVQLRSYGPRDHQGGAVLALETAVAALRSFEARLGPYPFTELDIVSTPTRALGIEYPGIFANAERLYDLSGATGGRPNATILESTTAHETAHQWFYSLVGSDQLDEPWLDESLTQYATYLYFVDRYGEENAQGFFDSLLGRWEGAADPDLPIGLPAEAYSGQNYGAIVYGRGPIFIHELAQTMGREAFDGFLRDYNLRFRYQIATAAEFRALAEEWCACDLGPLFVAWVDSPPG